MNGVKVEAWSSDNNATIATGKNRLEEEIGENIFDLALLEDLDLLNLKEVTFNPPIKNCLIPGPSLRLRPLHLMDYSKGFLQLLSQLTKVGDISEEQWRKRFLDMKRKCGTYFVMVVEDSLTWQVVGATTLVVEQKFIHECSQVGRVEDVVVCDQYRGRQLGKFLVASAVLLAHPGLSHSAGQQTENLKEKSQVNF